MSNNETKATIQLNPDDMLITFNTKLTETTNALLWGMNSIEQINSIPENINVSPESMLVFSPIAKMDMEQSRDNFQHWIIKKGFEDLIIAINELLLSFTHIIDLQQKFLERNYSLKELQRILIEPNENSKSHIPVLINKVESSLISPLKYRQEILSINKTRNCLVHRNGYVQKNDFNEMETLKLEWWFYNFFTEHRGLKEQVRDIAILTNETKFIMEESKRSLVFKKNQRITIDLEQFNELCLFCQRFGIELLENFKKSLNKKTTQSAS